MACTTVIPVPPIPLPPGFSVAPPSLPPIPDIDLQNCCKNIAFSLPPIPLPLPPLVVNPAFIAALTNAMAIVQAYLDSLPLFCPKE